MAGVLGACVARVRLALALVGILLLFGAVYAAATQPAPARTTLVPGPVEIHYTDGTVDVIQPEQAAPLQIYYVAKTLQGKEIESIFINPAVWQWAIQPPEWTPTVDIQTSIYITYMTSTGTVEVAEFEAKSESLSATARDGGQTPCMSAPHQILSTDLVKPKGVTTLPDGSHVLKVRIHSTWSTTDPKGQLHSGSGEVTIMIDYRIEKLVSYSISGTLSGGGTSIKEPVPSPGTTTGPYSLFPVNSQQQILPLALGFLGAVMLVLAALGTVAARICRLL